MRERLLEAAYKLVIRFLGSSPASQRGQLFPKPTHRANSFLLDETRNHTCCKTFGATEVAKTLVKWSD